MHKRLNLSLKIKPFETKFNDYSKESFIPRVSRIRPYLFLGNVESSSDISFINDNNITTIINCTPDLPNKYEHQGICYIRIPISDILSEPIHNYFKMTYNIINKTKKNGGNVLIHCLQGISRSSTIVLAYLMKEEKKTFSEAFMDVGKYRQCISPNISFINQLIKLEKTINYNE